MASTFNTILQCIFECTAMHRYVFQIIPAQSNKCAQRDMSGSNSILYLGTKWMNINAGEIIRLFVIMMRISIELRNMRWYLTYFVEDTMIHLGHGYSVQLRGYYDWKTYVMTLIRFKHIFSAFHPESGTYFYRDICHQLRYFIRMLN